MEKNKLNKRQNLTKKKKRKCNNKSTKTNFM